MPITVNQIYDNPSILTNQESNLVASKEMTRFFGLPEDFIQLYVYNNLDTLVGSNINFQDYTVTDNKEVSFDPAVDIENLGFRLGTYKMVYNFFRPILTQNPSLDLFIKSISSDRKEIKISTTTDQNTLFNNTVAYIDLVQNRNYFIEYYLDFGNNNLQTGLSIAVEKDINENVFVILKLQNSLPSNISVNTPLNIVEKIVNTQEFQTILTSDITPTQNTLPSLRGANFSIETDNQFIGSSDYYNYNQIITYTGSQFQNVLNYISSSNPTINVDYTDYSNFVHFASAYQRLETFKDQLTKIETYQTYLSSITPSNPDYNIYINKIDSIIQGFDGYENYLYYESSSFAWPKQNTTKPYINYSVTSSQALNWYGSSNLSSPYYGGQVVSSSVYDEFNNDNLIYGLPTYIQEREDFENVKLFVNSIGQMFDDIWIYIKAMTDLWKADNKLTEGISKDLVADALKSLGIKLHTDGDQDDLYTYLYGVNSTGAQNFVTQSWQTGVTSSTYTMSGQDEAKSIFKRIYHNLPTLLKSKGTTRFINYLNTLYGVPETILYPIEYGGVDKNTTTSEYNYNKFTYALQFSGSSRFVTFNNSTSSSLNLKTLEFRFKPNVSSSTPQVLISESSGAYSITLETTSSNGYSYGNLKLNSGSYNNFTTLPFYVTSSNDYNWWNVVWTNYNTGSIVYVKSEVNGEIGHQGSILCPTTIPDSGSYSIKLGSNFYGQLQEFRGWSEILSESIVNTHTLNPESYVGNTSSSINNLLFHFPLGNDLNLINTTTTGSQPKINSNYYLTFTNVSQSNYVSFTEKYYSSPAIGGYSTPVTDKIRIIDTNVATTRLQPLKSVLYNPTSSRTLDIHVTQTGFSPQDQINNDIIAQLGTTYNLDDIIGNPKLANLDTYPELDILKENYFSKYNNPYNYKDFINLIETFHKSLFRYLADYIPGRSNNNTGVVIKSHILERNKVKRYEPTLSTSSYEGEISTVSISGSNSGNYCCTRNSSENEAFYTGELSGSFIDINNYYTQNNPFTLLPTQSSLVNFSKQYGGWDALNNNVSNNVQSNVKYKDIYVSKSIDTSALNCIRWKVTRNPVSAINQIMYVTYTACDGNFNCLQLNASGPSYNNTVSDYVVAREDGPPQLSTNSGIAPCFNTTNTTSDFFTSSFDSYVVLRDKNIFTHFSRSIEWQDSLLSDSGYVSSREEGVKLTSLNFNEPIINGNIGQVIGVEQTTPYMLYFDWAGGTLAEKQGSANYHIKFLIDESGSVFSPEYSSSYYYLTDQGFGCNKPVNVTIYNSLGTYNNIETTVYRPLKRFETILYSDTGSQGTNQLQPGYFTTISFITPSNNYISNLDEDFNLNGDYNPISSIEKVKYNIVVKNPNGGWNQNLYEYVVLGTPTYLANISYHVRVDVNSNAGDSRARAVIYITRNGRNIQLGSSYDDSAVTTSGVTLSGTANNIALLQGDKIWVQITYLNISPGNNWNDGNFFISDDDTYLVVRNSSTLNTSLTATSSFWFTGSNNTVLTASSQLSSFYGGFKQNNNIAGYTLNSGFSDPLLFTIQQYDQIRFGGKEESTYTIISSSFNDPYNLNPGTKASGSGNIVSMDLPFTASIYYNNVTYSFIASPTLSALPIINTGNNQIYYFYTGSSTANSVNSLKNIINFVLSGSGATSNNLVIANTSSNQLQLTSSNVGFDYNTLYLTTGSSPTYNLFTLAGGTDPNPENLCLYLDRSPQGQNINYFSIRRLVPDPGFIILNTTNVEGPGFIIPKYPTSTLSNNLPNIIQDLSAKNLIP